MGYRFTVGGARFRSPYFPSRFYLGHLREAFRNGVKPMRRLFVFLAVTLSSLCLAALRSPVAAQLPPVNNPLAPPQSPALAGCSTTDASSCAQVASKLLPLVMGPSPMEENLRRLSDEIGGRVTGSPEMPRQSSGRLEHSAPLESRCTPRSTRCQSPGARAIRGSNCLA